MMASPIVMVPVRAAPVPRSTLMARGATPGPAPLVIVIHEALDDGVQLQPSGETTLKLAEPPGA